LYEFVGQGRYKNVSIIIYIYSETRKACYRREGESVYFKGKRILIIGGTGTIGMQVIHHIIKDSPQLIRVYSRDEYKQSEVIRKWKESKSIDYMIGDVRDQERIEEAMLGMDYVIHVAAMKRVEMSELNPIEVVKTNILGTYNVMRAALKQKVKKVVFTSTDKAISPTNVYGATKLIAERLIATSKNDTTIFASVRFGNVIGSRGSVIPLFQKQIMENQSITVTNDEMTRFMMTMDQATALTIKALKEAKGGEIFVLKMPVIKLKDLVALIIEETCAKHRLEKEQIQIEQTGLRPGEKMYEELMTEEESRYAWELPDMFIIPSDKEQVYSNAKKATEQKYSSSQTAPLSKESLRQLLLKANVWNKEE
jgi:FlaA1/EpsC-like NDP-sugar epimerase